jgi:polysaccharide biosynthesis protein PslH
MLKTLAMDTDRAIVISPVLPYPEVGGSHKRTMRLLEAMEAAHVVPHIVTGDGRDEAAAAALRSRGWAVDVVAGERATVAARAGQHLRRLPSPYLGGVAARVAELVAEGCAFVQVEHTQSAYYDAALGDAPWVLSLHNVDSALMRSIMRAERPLTRAWVSSLNRWRALRSVERRAIPWADAVLCVSEADRGALEPLARRVVLVENGVDDGFFQIPPELPPGEAVLFFGQFDYAPNALGIERFLREGWPLVIDRRPDARLRLVGGGIGPELRELAARTRGVETLGFVPELTSVVASSRVVLVPVWAGGGTRLKALESLAAARPVAGTPLGMEGIGFEGGVHGELGENPADLARLTAELLTDGIRARRLAAAGRELAERFRWQRTTAPAERLYRELAERQSRDPGAPP